MQWTGPVIGSSGDDAIQFRVAEFSFDNSECHHAFAFIVRRRRPEVAGTSRSAVAILDVLGFESPFCGHDSIPPRAKYITKGLGDSGPSSAQNLNFWGLKLSTPGCAKAPPRACLHFEECCG